MIEHRSASTLAFCWKSDPWQEAGTERVSATTNDELRFERSALLYNPKQTEVLVRQRQWLTTGIKTSISLKLEQWSHRIWESRSLEPRHDRTVSKVLEKRVGYSLPLREPVCVDTKKVESKGSPSHLLESSSFVSRCIPALSLAQCVSLKVQTRSSKNWTKFSVRIRNGMLFTEATNFDVCDQNL